MTITLDTVDHTLALGERIGNVLTAGDVVILSGSLGAGKTTLTKGIAAGMGVRGLVTSPTFVIARVHRPAGGQPATPNAAGGQPATPNAGGGQPATPNAAGPQPATSNAAGPQPAVPGVAGSRSGGPDAPAANLASPPAVPLVHVDAYRLSGALELDDLDLDTDLAAAAVVIEWGEGVAERLADDRLQVQLTRLPDDSRTAELVPVGGSWERRVPEILAALPSPAAEPSSYGSR